MPVIEFRQANETKLYSENGCIIGEAFTSHDFARLKDKLLYVVYDVI